MTAQTLRSMAAKREGAEWRRSRTQNRGSLDHTQLRLCISGTVQWPAESIADDLNAHVLLNLSILEPKASLDSPILMPGIEIDWVPVVAGM